MIYVVTAISIKYNDGRDRSLFGGPTYDRNHAHKYGMALPPQGCVACAMENHDPLCRDYTDVVISPQVSVSGPRDEVIDTDTNELFQGATSPWDVEDRYEAFWNRLNPGWEGGFPPYKEKVKVLSVVRG